MIVNIPVSLVFALSPLFLTWGKKWQEWLWDAIKSYKAKHDSSHIVDGFLNLFQWIAYGFILLCLCVAIANRGMQGGLIALAFFFGGALCRGNKWAYNLFCGVLDFLKPIKNSISEKIHGKKEKEEKEALS